MTLSETWFMEGYIDFELQRYRLLAYLQEVRNHFRETKLYPQLADIVAHYNNLIAFRNSKHTLQNAFPKTASGIDPDRLQIMYDRLLADNDVMQELEEITAFAAAQMKGTIDEGAGIYDLVEKKVNIEPVGIMPLYKNEGYVLLRMNDQSDVNVYTYTVTIFEQPDARYRGLRMTFVDKRTKNLANTWEQIKLDIVRDIRILPNPAVYRVEVPMTLPFQETVLPVTRRMLIKYIANEAA